jgi:hypothetical protein
VRARAVRAAGEAAAPARRSKFGAADVALEGKQEGEAEYAGKRKTGGRLTHDILRKSGRLLMREPGSLTPWWPQVNVL